MSFIFENFKLLERAHVSFSFIVPPSIADEVTELVVSRLSPVVIGCTASGVPHPSLYWSKDGLRLAENGEGYTILPSGFVILIKKKYINKKTFL